MKYYTNKNLPGIKGQVTYYNDRLEQTIIETVPPVVHQLSYERTSPQDVFVYKSNSEKNFVTAIDGRTNNNRQSLFDYKMTDKQLGILSRPTFNTGSGKQHNDLTSVIILRGSHEHASIRKLEDLGLVTVHNDSIYATVKGRFAGIGLNLSLSPMQNVLRFKGKPFLMDQKKAEFTYAQMTLDMFVYLVDLYRDKTAFNADYDKLEALIKDVPTLDDVLFISEERERDLRIKLSRSEMALTDARHKNYLLSNRISEFVDMLKGQDEEDHHLSVTWDTKAGKSWLNLGQFEDQFIRINEVMHGTVKIETFNHLAK